MNIKKDLSKILAATTILFPFSGCATARMVYHGVNYKLGNYVDYVDEGRVLKSDDERAYEQELLSRAKLESVINGDDHVYVLHVQGTPYERGRQQGILLREQVRENVSFVNNLRGVYEAVLDKKISELKDEIKETTDSELISNLNKKLESKNKELYYLENGYNLLEPFIPEHFKEEMRGLADGAEVSLDAVQFYQAVGDIAESGCSNYVLGKDSTANKEMLQVRILDFPLAMKVQKNSVVTIAKPDIGNSFVNVGWAGFIGTVTGLNEKKITLVEMRGNNAVDAYYKANEGERKETLQGIPMPFLLRDVLQFDNNLEEVTRRIENAKRTNAYVYVIGDGKTDKSRAFITDHELFQVYGADTFKDVLSLVEPDTSFRQIDDVIFGGHNNSLINDKISENYSRITEEMLKEDFNKALAMKDNLQIAIWNLTNMTLQVANADGTSGEEARACNQNYVFIDLNKEFNWFEH
ncbi:hypothetical protein HY837_06430 [archaeon]|nr:hypothetical protein [archaeon]